MRTKLFAVILLFMMSGGIWCFVCSSRMNWMNHPPGAIHVPYTNLYNKQWKTHYFAEIHFVERKSGFKFRYAKITSKNLNTATEKQKKKNVTSNNEEKNRDGKMVETAECLSIFKIFHRTFKSRWFCFIYSFFLCVC